MGLWTSYIVIVLATGAGVKGQVTSPCSHEWLLVKLNEGEYVTYGTDNYPNAFNKKASCRWKIWSAQGTFLETSCESPFKLRTCSLDYLVFAFDDNHNEYFGVEKPPTFASSNSLQVYFRAMDANDDPRIVGFRCTTKAVPKQIECTCGIPNPSSRIMGGQPVGENQFPWHVAFIGEDGEIGCSGALISDRYILTAAQCISEFVLKYIIIGGHYFGGNVTLPWRKELHHKRGIRYHRFLPDYMRHDIGLVELEEPIDITDPHYTPICLPKDPKNRYVGNITYSTGWETHAADTERTDYGLLMINQTVVTTSECSQIYDCHVTDNHICAFEQQSVPCTGDSGNPVFVKENGKCEAVGVTSWSYGCDGFNYMVATRVTSYVNWIMEYASKSSMCVNP